jgi:hypothetical protein
MRQDFLTPSSFLDAHFAAWSDNQPGRRPSFVVLSSAEGLSECLGKKSWQKPSGNDGTTLVEMTVLELDQIQR